jgi:hypothetical protein
LQLDYLVDGVKAVCLEEHQGKGGESEIARQKTTTKHYRQMTEAAQARAAEVRSRLEKYIASKKWKKGSVPTMTKPETPQVLKRNK